MLNSRNLLTIHHRYERELAIDDRQSFAIEQLDIGMLKAKLLAMCVCPAVLAPPAILAVHRPARHAVSHLLQRTAHRLDARIPAVVPAPKPAIQYASAPCAPTIADAGGAGTAPTVGRVGLAVLSPAESAIYSNAAPLDTSFAGFGNVIGA